MLESFNTTKLLHEILGLQKDVYANEVGKPIIVKDSYINEFSKSENSVRIIFDHVNLKVLHISENIETMGGYSPKDFYRGNLLFALQLFAKEHNNFIYVWLKWAFAVQVKYGTSFKGKQAICGIKAKHKDGHILRLLFRQCIIKETATGVVTVSAITLDDITHIMKSDFYWGRIECGTDEKYFHHLISTEKEDKAYDILSEREKETLRLLMLGKESKEIANDLFISSHTVDNHRRNMIQKLGVRDTTGLAQICKMVGII